jgi:hypothetical protein
LTKEHQTESGNRLQAEVLNVQFKSVFTNKTKTPTFQKNHIQIYELCLTSASQQGELSKKLHELKTNKSTGPNGVPARIQQLHANEVAV